MRRLKQKLDEIFQPLVIYLLTGILRTKFVTLCLMENSGFYKVLNEKYFDRDFLIFMSGGKEQGIISIQNDLDALRRKIVKLSDDLKSVSTSRQYIKVKRKFEVLEIAASQMEVEWAEYNLHGKNKEEE